MIMKPELNVSDEMLMALADGELTGPDASKLMARIKANPELAERYALFSGTAEALRQAMDPGPVPDYLISTVLTAPAGADADRMSNPAQNTVAPDAVAPDAVAPVSNVTALRPNRIATRQLVWPMALAASVALAAGIGGFLAGQSTAPVSGGGIELAAAALSETATGDSVILADGRSARAMGSFTTDLGLCRLIAVDDTDSQIDRAIVCRDETSDDAGWRTALSVTEGGSGQFLPASDIAVEMIDNFLDVIGAGPALTATEEAQALTR
jgi:hypothetical protein